MKQLKCAPWSAHSILPWGCYSLGALLCVCFLKSAYFHSARVEHRHTGAEPQNLHVGKKNVNTLSTHWPMLIFLWCPKSARLFDGLIYCLGSRLRAPVVNFYSSKGVESVFFCFVSKLIIFNRQLQLKFVCVLYVARRTPCLGKGPTSPVTSAWLCSTAPTAAVGRKASWARCSAASPCAKSSITRTSSARWSEKVCRRRIVPQMPSCKVQREAS